MFHLRGHTEKVYCVAFSPDGRTLASGAGGGTIILWDLASRAERLRIDALAPQIVDLEFTPGGDVLAGCQQGGLPNVRTWDVRTGRRVGGFQAGRAANCVAISPDGKTLASGGIGRGDPPCPVYRWDLQTGQELPSLAGHAQQIGGMAYSPDGSAAGHGGHGRDGQIMVGRGEELASLRHRGAVRGQAFSGDGRRLVTAAGTLVQVWDLDPPRKRHTLRGHKRTVSWVDHSPAGPVAASVGEDATIRLWDADAGRERVALDFGLGKLLCVAFAPDGLTGAAAGHSGDVVVWDVEG